VSLPQDTSPHERSRAFGQRSPPLASQPISPVLRVEGETGYVPDAFWSTVTIMMNPVFWLIWNILEIYKWIVLIAVVMSWLLAFNVINYHNNFVRGAVRTLEALTEPVFRQARRIIPTIGGIDLSPILVFLAIGFLQYAITYFSVMMHF